MSGRMVTRSVRRRLTYRRSPARVIARNRIRRWLRKRIRRRRTIAPWGRFTGFPLRMNFKFKYCRTFDTVGVADSAYQVFALNPNSIYSPDPSFGGHQPLYHDNMSSIYQKYVVNYWKVKCTFMMNEINNYSDGIGQGARKNILKAYLVADNEGTDYATNSLVCQELAGNRWFKRRILNATTNSRFPTMKITCRPSALQNVPKHDDSLQATFGTSPQKLDYCYLLVSNYD